MLHSQTTLILAALIFLVLPLLMWWATSGQRSAALIWWCAGSLLVSAGVVSMGLRPWVPGWLSYNGANSMLIAGTLLWAQSLRVMLGSGWPLRWLVLAVFMGGVYYTVLLNEFSPNTRGMGMRAALGALTLYTAWMAMKLARRMQSYNAAAISVCFLALSLGLFGHLLLLGGGGAKPNPFSNTWDASVIASMALATSVVGHFCFTGMALDASIREQVRVVRARTEAEESIRFEAQLRLLDRQDRMVLVSGVMAHELNQPLAAALMQAQVVHRHLRTEEAEPAKLAEWLEQVSLSLRRASAILDRIRSSAKMQGVMSRELLDLREVVQATVGLLEAEWRQQGVQVALALGPDPLWCKGDEVALSQVVLNLLRNATEAAPPGTPPRLDIRTVRTGGEVQVSVRDHGLGVPAEVLAQWGEPFKTTREQGLGLGLAISRAIAQQHQGRLGLRNHPQGGAEAVLALPIAAERPA